MTFPDGPRTRPGASRTRPPWFQGPRKPPQQTTENHTAVQGLEQHRRRETDGEPAAQTQVYCPHERPQVGCDQLLAFSCDEHPGRCPHRPGSGEGAPGQKHLDGVQKPSRSQRQRQGGYQPQGRHHTQHQENGPRPSVDAESGTDVIGPQQGRRSLLTHGVSPSEIPARPIRLTT